MIVPKVSDLIGIINKIAPSHLAEEWDNPGLQVGDPTATADRIMVALDPVKASVDAATVAGCSLLVTHHPLLFKPLKKISAADPQGALLFSAIRNGLSVISLHTNYDSADNGLNDLLARRIGLTKFEPLKPSRYDDLVKLAVYVPKGHEDGVMAALFRFSGLIGNYDQCSFRVEGTGTFRPLDGAEPFIGTVGTRENVEESRIEVLLKKTDLAAATAALIKAHPYEEPAYDLYPLVNRGKGYGLGRIGELEEPATVAEFAAGVKKSLAARGVRFVGESEKKVKRVALCSGSGMSLLQEAARRGADLLLTGDVKYHEAQAAQDLGVALVDAGHFPTEAIMVDELTERLRTELAARGYGSDVVPCRSEEDPFHYLT